MAGKTLIIYNTCGLHGRDNTEMYRMALAGIRMQQGLDARIIWSDCGTSAELRRSVHAKYPDLAYSFVDKALPLPITANLAVKRAIKLFGEFDLYVYTEVGLLLHAVPTLIAELRDCAARHSEAGIINGLVDYDNALPEYSPRLEGPDDYVVVPHNAALNLHVVAFSQRYVRAWDNAILPDVFFNNGSEAVFWMMAASIGNTWIAYLPTRAKHIGGGDGPNLTNPSYPPHVPMSGGRPFADIYKDGHELGFGWDVLVRFTEMKKDMACYDDYGFARDTRLYNFLKQNLFIGYDYDSIPGTFGEKAP